MAVKDVGQVDFSKLTQAIKDLNAATFEDSDGKKVPLLAKDKKVVVAGKKKQDVLDAFLEAIESIPEERVDDIPDSAYEMNNFVCDESEPEGGGEPEPEGEKREKEQEAPPAATGKKNGKEAGSVKKDKNKKDKKDKASKKEKEKKDKKDKKEKAQVERNELGYKKGSVRGTVTDLLLAGTSMKEAVDTLVKKHGRTEAKAKSSLFGMVKRLSKQGHKIETSFKVTPAKNSKK